MTMTDPATRSAIRVLQAPKRQDEIVLHVTDGATADEIKASMCSCVVHLCGCK